MYAIYLLIKKVVYRQTCKTIILLAGSVLIGIAIVSIPQIICNYYQYGLLSMKVVTGEGDGLFASQLYWGMYVQKYETYVGTDNINTGMAFIDKAGQYILEREGITQELLIKEYIMLVFIYPLDFMGIYVRHFINMIDMRYPNIYLYNLNESFVYPFTNYILLYFGTIKAFLYMKEHKYANVEIILLGIVCIPTFLIVPGAVEVRFGAMIHTVLLAILFSDSNFNNMKNMICQKKWLLEGIGLLIFICFMCAVCGSTLATLTEQIILY